MSGKKKLRVAFLWHMHQPFYFNPQNNKFAMPWVRLHALKDYLDMPLTAARHGIKATFNLVPSLLDQIELYCRGFKDRHQELSYLPAKEISLPDKIEILKTFFDAHFPTMIDPFLRYRQLYRKRENCMTDLNLAAETFSTSEFRDLQVWSNLVWIDPMFRNNTIAGELINKSRDFTESDKEALLQFELELMGKIIPTYQTLYNEGKIDISLTPYYHPILPLLIDSNTAREAVSDIKLPQNRFQYRQDAHWQVSKSIEKFSTLFGKNLAGMWPSEGSVSEETLHLINDQGIKWVATDQEILRQSLIKGGESPNNYSPHFAYIYDDLPSVKIFFRDHGLSDKIGFVYSGWEPARAVKDFITNLKGLGEILKNNLDNCVVPVILDGENAWEYFPNDATEFLNGLYQALSLDDSLEIISFGEAAANLPARKIKRLFAGSWINHNFRIWIGHSEDNAAWDLLYETRKMLTDYQKQHPETDAAILEKAWKQIHIAEGSDWFWWYGDDHIGIHNHEFDQLFRIHLGAVYQILGLPAPKAIAQPIHRGRIESFLSYPETLITPQIDGLVTHYYEWSGAGFYDCDKAGGAMHRVDIVIRALYFAFDHDFFYIRLDFNTDFNLVGKGNLRIIIDCEKAGKKEFKLTLDKVDEAQVSCIYKRVFEAKIARQAICEKGHGLMNFFVMLYHDSNLIEKWPLDEPIALKLPERDKEIFWQI